MAPFVIGLFSCYCTIGNTIVGLSSWAGRAYGLLEVLHTCMHEHASPALICSMCSVLCVVEVSSGNVLRQPQDL